MFLKKLQPLWLLLARACASRFPNSPGKSRGSKGSGAGRPEDAGRVGSRLAEGPGEQPHGTTPLILEIKAGGGGGKILHIIYLWLFMAIARIIQLR